MNQLQQRAILVVLLVLIAFGLLTLNQSGALEPVRNLVLAPLTALQRSIAAATGGSAPQTADVAALQERNAELEAQVTELQGEVVQLRENEAQLNLLAGLLSWARTQPDNTYLAANVIGRDPSPFVSFIILDRGSDHGVARDMPVVTERGLVGRVVEVTSTACKVQLILDADSAVNARLQKSRDEGVVVGRLAGGLQMQFISQQAQVQPGDTVVTSGLGGTYPAGIVLGTVRAVEKQDFEVLQSADLVTGVDFSRLEIVLIIVNFKPVDLGAFFQPTSTPAAAAP